jgi:hypothetical protein
VEQEYSFSSEVIQVGNVNLVEHLVILLNLPMENVHIEGSMSWNNNAEA